MKYTRSPHGARVIHPRRSISQVPCRRIHHQHGQVVFVTVVLKCSVLSAQCSAVDVSRVMVIWCRWKLTTVHLPVACRRTFKVTWH